MSQRSSLAKIFNRTAVAVPPEQKENKEKLEVNSDYKLSNASLVSKNASLRNEVTSLKMKIADLKKELLEKDEKIALLEGEMDQEKIDLFVAERFKKKMKNVSAITEKAIRNLGKAAEEYQTVFLDMKSCIDPCASSEVILPAPLQRKCPVPRPKTISSKPSLDKKSPLVRNRVLSEPDIKLAANVTVRRTPRAGRASFDENPANNLNATPKAAPRPCSTAGATAEGVIETDTVRRKRVAASKITSFAEPRLNLKLRRPGNMGNCITKNKRQEPSPILTQGLPRTSLWVADSDFENSIPDLDKFGEKTEEPATYRPTTSSLAVPDGYSTAPEDLSEEEELPIAGPSINKNKARRLSSEKSEYLTGDETEAAVEKSGEEDPSLQALKKTLELEAGEDNDTPQIAHGDERPISSLATPLKLNEISPRIVEGLADKKGRVKKRTVQRYLEIRRDAAQPVG